VKRLALLAFLFLAGCAGDPDFKAITTAPPGATSEIHSNKSNDTHSIRVTEGLALAVECTDAKRRPCSFDGTTIDDDGIASFRRGYADLQNKEVYSRGYEQKSSLNRTVFVVTGKKVGKTTMTVRTGYGDVPVQIEVLPAK
jgi:hypothetical protein